ncbi:hypothetical protein HYH03_001100 [Edaphochlamys debaryana]|uniref:Uncharacterized protein n=1 Tax=Edaphochlamys debaryana TaxID=47281 RepID=A0A835YED2_9CHLO|nr:hypothetical protein HYH03_001100 [Edaphochlamys debaryana]|eukprot:KAG2501300.1 hypothetical protein HYH03_001100 [Edaphochlamys debaryana]
MQLTRRISSLALLAVLLVVTVLAGGVAAVADRAGSHDEHGTILHSQTAGHRRLLRAVAEADGALGASGRVLAATPSPTPGPKKGDGSKRTGSKRKHMKKSGGKKGDGAKRGARKHHSASPSPSTR